MKQSVIVIILLSIFVSTALIVGAETNLLKLAADNKWNDILTRVRNGEDVNRTDNAGRTLLMYCAQLSYPKILDELIRLDSNINRLDINNQSALHYAVKNGQYEQVIKLIKAGADLSNGVGNELISFALSWDDSNTTLALIALGAIPDKTDYSKLSKYMIEATERPLTQAALKLLNFNLDFNYQDKTTKTALMYAAHRGHNELVAGLIAAGANIEEKDRRGRTALGYAVKASISKEVFIKDPLQELFDEQYSPDYKSVIETLIKSGATVNKEMTRYLIDKDGASNFWNYYMRSQLYYWEIILYYIGIILAMVLMFGQFDKVVDGVAIFISIIVGLLTTIGLIANNMPELQFMLTTTGAGTSVFAVLRALVVTAFALSLIYLIWQLLETSTDTHHCIIIDDDLCCPDCGKPLTLANKNKGFCPFCKKRFKD